MCRPRSINYFTFFLHVSIATQQITNPDEYDLTPEQIKSIETQILEKLEKMTSIGLVCLDQKPGNILIKHKQNGTLRVVLTDFDTKYCCKLNHSNISEGCDLQSCERISQRFATAKNLSQEQLEYIVVILVAQLREPFAILFQQYLATKRKFFTKEYDYLDNLENTEMDSKTKQYMTEIEEDMDTEPSFTLVSDPERGQFEHYVRKPARTYW